MRKHFDAVCVAVTVFALVFTVLFVNGAVLGIREVVDVDAEAHSDDTYFTENDLNASWDTSGATTITLAGDTASFSGSGVYTNGADVYIGASGTYVVSGSLDGGSLVVAANDNSKVWILLDGVSITRDDDACLVVEKADKVFVTLADGSDNTLTSGAEFSDEAVADGHDGAIFARDDLTINGTGSLKVTAGYKHGIAANDDLVITGGTMDVTAAKDGLHANDSLRVCGAMLSVHADDDGLATDNDEAFVYLESGTYTIEAADEGIYAPGNVTIAGGDFSIAVGTESGHHGIKCGDTCTITGGTLLISECYEGIQATYIDIVDGDLTIYPADDGLNASSGEGTEGFGAMGGGAGGMGGGRQGGHHEDANGTRGDANGTMPQMPEGGRPGDGEGNGTMPQMPEGGRPDGGSEGNGTMPQMPDGGQMPQEGNASEPGVAPAGGEGGEGANGESSSDGAQETPWLHISGGSITIINNTGRDADGLDSNGDIIITGGDVRVSLLGSGSNSAIDYGSENGGVCEISGGTVVACGSYSMAEGFDATSTQCSILYNISSGAEAGSTISLVDANGDVLLSYEVPCSFTSASLSCPQMQVGETYSVVIGDSAEEVTLSDTAISSGDVQSTMFGGGFHAGGGMQAAGDSGQGDDSARPWGHDHGQDGFMGQTNQTEQANQTADGEAAGGQQPPQQNGTRPGEGATPPGQDTDEATDDATAQEEAASKEYTTETLVLCGVSAAVLVVALFFVRLFRRH